MQYVGLQTQIWKNNTRSLLLLVAFPALMLGLVYLGLFILEWYPANQQGYEPDLTAVNDQFMLTAPVVAIAVAIWFLIAWMSHSRMIERATGAKPLERRENMRIYNLVENLCIASGMTMPKVNIIEDDSLNAFASGLSSKTYTVTLSRGIIDKLDDAELEAVIAHELTHIQNRDVRLLIISIIFVGIFAFVAEAAFRMLLYGGGRSRGKKDGGGAILILVLVLGVIGLLLSTLFRFALSRKREYLADAGAAEMTKNPLALASALRKISGDPTIEAVKRDDVAQMFIEHPRVREGNAIKRALGGLFATHPPIEKRIQILEQF